MAREVNRFLGLVFAQRHKDGRTDLEAVESALRAALHQAGAAALAELLKFEAPAAEQRQLPCPCGHHAQYQELRSKPVVTIVGPVREIASHSGGHQELPADGKAESIIEKRDR